MLDLAEKALKFAESRADYSEVRFEKALINRIICNNGSIDAVDSSESIGICIRILHDGALGAAFINKPDFSLIKKTILDTIKMASASKKALESPIRFSEEKPNKANYEVKQKEKLQDINEEEKIKEIKSIDKSLLQTKLKIPMRFLQIDDEVREELYINSEGSRIRSIMPRIGFQYLITVSSGNEVVQRINQHGVTGGWEFFKKWRLEKKLTDEAILLSKISKSKKSPTGKLDLVLSPSLVGIASHESTGHPYEADRILGREAAQAGESFLTKDHLGKRIGSEVVNLVDDPTIPNSNGFYLYDDEGVKARRRFLIKNGIIHELLHNRWSAAEFNTHSNGSARSCNWDAEPIVRMANTFVLPGDHKLEELIEGIKKGILMKSYMEWNIDDKRYNQKYVGLEAYEIVNGRLGRLVKKPRIELTTPSFWSSIDALSKDVAYDTGTCGKGEPMQGVPVWFGGPYARLRNVVIA